MSTLLILPLLIPALAAALGLVLPRRVWPRRALALVATGALTAVAAWLLWEVWHGGVLVLRVGGWKAPVGITLAADLLGALMVLLSGVMGLAGVVYGAGTLEPRLEASLNLADLAWRLPGTSQPALATAAAMLLIVVFGLKAALFPFFFWLPASYHTPPVVVTTLFSALLTKVGLYALFRTFTLLFTGDPGLTHQVLLGMALLSMVTGVLGAVAQYDFRRLLSFHIISQMGYLLAGLAFFSRAALAASIAYWVHYVFAKSALFFVTGATERATGTQDLARMGGLARTHPVLAWLFLVPALSLAGVPPLSGFFAKMGLLRAALREEAWWVAGVGAAVGLLTLFSMMKVWREAFWKPPPHEPRGDSGPAALLGPCVALALLMVALGLGARPLYLLADAAAAQLLEPGPYIHAILGDDT